MIEGTESYGTVQVKALAKKTLCKHKTLIFYVCPVMKFILEMRKWMFVEKQALMALCGTWCCTEM